MPGIPLQLPPEVLQFVAQLALNNDREWFGDHKDQFLVQQGHMIAFADALLSDLRGHDELETASGKEGLQRIYRDTRFSNDKRPYKTYWGGGFRRAGKRRRGGYYFHVEPGNKSFAGGGFWGPNTADLRRIREDIAFDPAPLQQILNNAAFAKAFGTMKGEQLKTTPKGFAADHEAIDLLRYKQFLLLRPFSDEEVLQAGFYKEMGRTFRLMRPFLDYMSEVLSTDINGLEP
jgi:uncharacterized protein (TIGR02453 family)